MNKLISLVSLVLVLSARATWADLPPVDLSTIQIPNFSLVTENIMRGGRPADRVDFCALADLATHAVINIQGGDYSDNTWIAPFIPYWEAGEKPEEIAQEQEWVEASGMRYYSFPLNSLKPLGFAAALRIERILKTIHRESRVRPEGRLLIHCAHGNDRTGLIIALYRIRYQNWSAAEAYSEMRHEGHSLINMLTTWPLDVFFFRYANWLAKRRGTDSPTKWQWCQKLLGVYN